MGTTVAECDSELGVLDIMHRRGVCRICERVLSIFGLTVCSYYPNEMMEGSDSFMLA